MAGENLRLQKEQRDLILQAERDQKRLEEIAALRTALEAEKEKQTQLQNAGRTRAAQEQERQNGLLAQIGEKRGRLPCTAREEAEAVLQQKKTRGRALVDAIDRAAAALQATEKQIAQHEGQIRTLQEQLKDQPECDTAFLAGERDRTQAAFEQAEKTERAIDLRRRNNISQQKRLEEKSADAVRLEQEYRMMQDVADTAGGRIRGQAKLTLETYAQTALFDRILGYANLRLRHMSREHYELKRRQVKESGNQGQTGLDLDVIDHYNGTTREASTLSGGEGFLAALSLALGMSDAIQASAASAVRLDTMFVDEGFGSLSEGFLSLAMDELLDTAENGRRLIGIISHVEEVKNRMKRRIEVTKQDSGGSKAEIR